MPRNSTVEIVLLSGGVHVISKPGDIIKSAARSLTIQNRADFSLKADRLEDKWLLTFGLRSLSEALRPGRMKAKDLKANEQFRIDFRGNFL
jgi:hypothetical protein